MGIHISIGSIYAYSVFSLPLTESLGWDSTQIAWAFSLAILFLGLSASFLGPTVEKIGPRKSGLLSAVLFISGLLLAGLAVHLAWLPLFYIGYGVVAGTGIGIGYITPVSTLVKWFPDRRGLATGLAIMGFGFGSLLAGSLTQQLIILVGIPMTFFGLAALYGTLMTFSARILQAPPVGWMPEAMKTRIQNGQEKPRQDLADLDNWQALKTLRFYFLWVMLFINITCGIAIISVASPMAQEVAGLTTVTAATMVGLMGLFNGLGRIGWASLSDYLGRPMIYTIFFGIQIVAFLALPHLTHELLFQLVIFLIMTCYGGGFASIPAYIGDVFGTRRLAAIHGNLLTAWAAAGLVGPQIAATIREASGGYQGMLGVFVIFFIIAFTCSILIQVDIARLRRANQAKQTRPQGSQLTEANPA